MSAVRNAVLLLLALWLAACSASGARLNSDRIDKAYGSFGVEVLAADSNRRVSSLFSGSGTGRTTRTYAVIEFIGPTREPLRREHQAILSGASIGETFRKAGWAIRKQNLFIGELEVPASYTKIAKLMRIDLPAMLAVHQYLFIVSKDERTFTYAKITEVHHPDFMSAEKLRGIYGEILFDDSNRDSIHDFIGPPAVK